ncbi:ABC transporter ATP-binding protein [Corynebacterium spheniscorum]|uniref:Iron complex transport system ATP-binding protein n=1 Tax=Corynebacterium spheniscorum TaxID=185761 RepID=A0A1I2PQ32_9CORY|nr:ABC transporter ATP-binding protein [Corynebacterium spheniscorum]KAA8723751.1 ABC transporter ATP-binding protein [Corynebacterium spheniscorum]SFG15541.1 iron complex transport system ATP-binding protein [Corynebacterium spheniscorum]
MVSKTSTQTPKTVELQLNDLKIGYGRTTIIEGFKANPMGGGRIVGLLGPNASGKSTLIRTIAGVHPASAGSIDLYVDGALLNPKERRKACGYVPQDLPTAASLTAFETALVAARRTTSMDPVDRTAEIFNELQIGHIAQRYLSELSGGQRQLVAAAQMLVGNPSLMLLDEPTSALDLHHQLFLLEVLHRRVIKDNTLVLVALHDINLAARYCDELLVMRRGAVLAQGTPQEVLCSRLIDDVYQVNAEILDHHGTPVMTPLREPS